MTVPANNGSGRLVAAADERDADPSEPITSPGKEGDFMTNLQAVHDRFARNDGLPFADVLTEAKRLIYTHGPASVPFLEALATSTLIHQDDDSPPAAGPDLLSSKARALRTFEVRRIVGIVARLQFGTEETVGDADGVSTTCLRSRIQAGQI